MDLVTYHPRSLLSFNKQLKLGQPVLSARGTNIITKSFLFLSATAETFFYFYFSVITLELESYKFFVLYICLEQSSDVADVRNCR